MSVRNLIIDGKNPESLDFYLDGKRVTQMYLDGVLVWDIGNNFEIEVARNDSDSMVMGFNTSCFLDANNNAIEFSVDFGDGTVIEKYDGEQETYAEGIDKATIKIKAEKLETLTLPWHAGYTTGDTYIKVLKLSLPDGLKTIGDYSCYGLNSCTSISIPNTVVSIGKWGFKDCYKSIFTLPTKLETIGVNAFDSCTSLTEVTIPESVNFVGDYAFYQCTGLKKVIINQSCAISNYNFYQCELLSEVVISNNVTAIGNNVFYGCKALTSITIPDSVNSIGYYVFDGKYIRTINCNFTRQELVQKCALSQVIVDFQDGVIYTFHCTDGDIFLNGSDFR